MNIKRYSIEHYPEDSLLFGNKEFYGLIENSIGDLVHYKDIDSFLTPKPITLKPKDDWRTGELYSLWHWDTDQLINNVCKLNENGGLSSTNSSWITDIATVSMGQIIFLSEQDAYQYRINCTLEKLLDLFCHMEKIRI